MRNDDPVNAYSSAMLYEVHTMDVLRIWSWL